jgi:hypothetical protein
MCWGHLGIEFLPKGFLNNRWLNWHTTTTHHDLHHKHFNHNFGLYFTWWDRWFGTEDPKYRETFEEVTSREKVSEKPIPARVLKILVGAILLTNVAYAQSPVGTWTTFDEDKGTPRSIVQIEEKSSLLEGKIVSLYSSALRAARPRLFEVFRRTKRCQNRGHAFSLGF